MQGRSEREVLWLGLISSKGCQPPGAADGLQPLRAAPELVAVQQWHFGPQRAVGQLPWRQQQPSSRTGTSSLEKPKCVHSNHFGQHRSVGFTEKTKTQERLSLRIYKSCCTGKQSLLAEGLWF